MVLGTIFLGGHSYFLSLSNYLSEKKWDLKSVSQCPFKRRKMYFFIVLIPFYPSLTIPKLLRVFNSLFLY